MKKIMKKMKGKKVLSFVLAAIMLATTFSIALPELKLDANAAGSITTASGETITQTQIVDSSTRKNTYDNYAANFLEGASRPTDIVIPGLDPNQDYVIQGMTYYPQKDWMLVTAYYNATDDEISAGTVKSSKVFCLDAATGDFVAMFDFYNPGTQTLNTEHGGGIAISENNIYYACGDDDQEIAYAPLSALAGIENDPTKHRTIQLLDYVTINELGDSYTAYVCYDEGILWTGNFYDPGVKILGVSVAATDYSDPANAAAHSMVYGYKLVGNSSAEEWDYFKGKFQNLLNINITSGSSSAKGADFNWNVYKNSGSLNILGSITAPTEKVDEFVGADVATFYLTEGVDYTIEFTSTNNNSDLYMFAPNGGGHCNVKQSTQTTIKQLEDGRYYYKMNFTAGLKPAGADSLWPETQSTNGTYTGTYTLRFDQDAIQAGEARDFQLINIKVSQANTYDSDLQVYDDGSVGAPTYAICLNNAIKDVQYATVDNGKLYLSCSFGTGEGTNSVSLGGMNPYSQLIIADIDLSQAGTKEVTINGGKKILAYDMQSYKTFEMMPMSEGLCVIEDKIYITFESASNKYLNEAGTLTGNCNHPIDVIWELDPYALMEIEKSEPENSIYYEKVNGFDDIKDGEEYIIVYESDAKDPVTQKNILYAFDADGNFKGHKLSKSEATNLKGYDGMVGHPITEYSILKVGEKDALGNTYNRDILYLDNKEKDDVESVRWTISNINGTKYSIKNTDAYFANSNSFYFDANRITMLPNTATALLNNIDIGQLVAGNGYFYFNNDGAYLWCNDGLDVNYNTKANAYYATNGGSTPIYSGLTETPGTIHCNALNSAILGGSIANAEDGKAQAYPDGAFQIYRRVIDNVASTYESRVFTDLNAELQADGTYTIDLETYAISPNHYQYVGERPTDYILVADTSSSMASTGSTALIEYNGSLAVSSLSVEADTSDDRGVGINGYAFSNPNEDIYMKHTDGNFYKVYMGVNTTKINKWAGIITSFDQSYYVYYIADDGYYYCIQDHTNIVKMTQAEWKAWIDSGKDTSDYSTKTTNGNRRAEDVYVGVHYRFATNADEDGKYTRLGTIKTVANDLIEDIVAQNSQNRIALVKYGADASSGFYNTSSTFTQTDYTNAFFSASQKDTVKGLVNNLTTTTQTNNNGIEMDYVNNIISGSSVDYTATGDRNVVVIFMSDGIPGADSNSATASAANAVINKALTAKKNGAFIYSVLTGQASVSGFNKKTYMDAVSTKYAAATGMTEQTLGGESIDGVNYVINLSSCTLDTYINFGEVTTKEVEINTAVGLANLNASAILRQELSDSFKIPEGTQPVAKFIKGEFDAIGRFSFDEDNLYDATGVKVTPVDGAGNITVTGYDYSTQYIAKGKIGYKLRIRIEGVLADETKTIQNTPISNTATTALYQNSTQMSNGVVFKALPTSYFNIPKYTYVLDYGLKLLDTDVNGTLKSVSVDLSAQRDADGNLAYKTVSENGLVAIQEGNENLLYHNTPTNTTDSGYVLIQRDSGKYDWFEIEVVPASNVYFEEKEFATDAGTGTVAWTTTTGGTTEEYRSLPGENDIYGYDKAYDNENTYSNGTAFSASVDSTNKRSKTATVSFAGDGIDIVSACGPTTGMQIINIKDATGKSVAASIVDTYYADAIFSQVPIFSWRGAYGDYIVETTAVYLSTAGALTKSSFKNSIIDTGLVMNSSDSLNTTNVEAMLDAAGVEDIDAENLELVWFDDNSVLNGGTGVAPTKKGARAGETESVTLNNYLDGFRVYNPVGSDSSAYDVGEQNAVYHSVIDSLADGTLSDGSLDFASGTVAFVAGSLADGETLSFANYESVGPKNELYLQGGATTKGLFFKTPVADGGKVMISLRAVNGPTTVSINGSDPINVTSATEMYYDITDLLTVEDGAANVTIINTGSRILAVNNIKLTNTVSASGLMPLGMEDLETVQYYASMEPVQVSVKDGVITPVVIEDEIPDDGTNTGNNDTTTDNEETEESFSIFSLIEALLAFIKEILVNSVGSGNLF